VPNVEPPEATRLGEVAWLQPFPDALLEGAIDAPAGACIPLKDESERRNFILQEVAERKLQAF
jgi:hypothetical protein